MKANFILGKKQIILASLVLILGVAVYLNWIFANNDKDLELTNQLDVASQTDTKVDNPAPVADTEKTDANAKVTEKSENEQFAALPGVKDDTKKDAKDTDAKPTAADETKTDTKQKHLGDTLLVNAKTISNENYFTMAKLSRTKARDQSIETISTILNDEKLTDEDKQEVSAKALSITDIIETESRVENLIKAKGFTDCIVYITQTNASVVVKTDGLDQTQATQIKNIVVNETKVKGENISITEIK